MSCTGIRYFNPGDQMPIDFSKKEDWEELKLEEVKHPPEDWILRADENIKAMGYKAKSKKESERWEEMVQEAKNKEGQITELINSLGLSREEATKMINQSPTVYYDRNGNEYETPPLMIRDGYGVW